MVYRNVDMEDVQEEQNGNGSFSVLDFKVF
jgi:hypothetical protein